MKSNKKILKQIERKTNPLVVETIMLAKKQPQWKEISNILVGPRKNWKNVNIDEIKNIKEDLIIAGKILSQGEIENKKKIVALDFSEKAMEKLKKSGCEVITISEEIKKNPEMKGLKVLK